MGILRHLEHWLNGHGPYLQTAEFVPETHAIRLWADTFPWDAMVDAVTYSFAQRFPKKRPRGGRSPVSPRVLLALELLKHELVESDEEVCQRLRTDVAVMYACGLREVPAEPSHAHFVLPETLSQFRHCIDQDLMDELVAIQSAAAMEEGLVSPAHLLVDTFSSEQGSQRVTDATTLYKSQKNLHLIEQISEQCTVPAPTLRTQAHELHQNLQTVMRSFGRQCRGQGKVFVKLVCETERHLLHLDDSIETWTQQAKDLLHQDPHLGEAQRQHLLGNPEAASDAHRQIVKQSQHLTRGKKLSQFKIVNAYDPTLAPIIKGKSNCPAQFGRKTGILSEPASGFVFANRVPEGKPSDSSYVLPMLDKVQRAIDLVTSPQPFQVHSLGGDLGVNDLELRRALHGRSILSVGISTTVEAINPQPSPEEVLAIFNASGLNRIRTPYQVHLACASGYSRSVVESHIATLMSRGAGALRYKGLDGAIVQMGMTVMAHNASVLVRIRQQRLSKRGQKFRRLIGLRRHNIK